jgi:glycosyltransferase involved in cell wall biosynthesis
MNVCLVGTVSISINNFREKLVLDLVSMGANVYIFAIDFNEETKNYVRSLGATPLDYSLQRTGLNPFRDIKAIFDLYNVIKQLNCDAVLTYTVKPVIYASIAAKLAGVKNVVGMLEGLGYSFTKLPEGSQLKQVILKNLQKLLYWFSSHFIDKFIFLNCDDKLELKGVINTPADNVYILGGIGVDLALYKESIAPAPDKIRFIFIGRFLREKGIHEYIQAAKSVKKIHNRVEFVVLGGLDEENPGGLSKSDLNILVQDQDIIYPGYVNNVKEWLESSSVFVLPSYREGYPMSTQEALAVGRAVITTDVPGCKDTVDPNVNGFIVPPWSSSALADAMLQFIENPCLIEKMGKASRKFAERNLDVNLVNSRLIGWLTQEKRD